MATMSSSRAEHGVGGWPSFALCLVSRIWHGIPPPVSNSAADKHPRRLRIPPPRRRSSPPLDSQASLSMSCPSSSLPSARARSSPPPEHLQATGASSFVLPPHGGGHW
ncbi:hypothetical protein PR202_gb22307 [Eleusine coracana subsp. coracana]|uniref:Uncharacterized protein n=1 Tax=Eleusine coracana subsp. coracana TaxID=191504 RepID=A0AAV5FFC3_ELECO|nr:hypothetical protein PR202_gb22307 [Eleusine coracana subsp. coracana]